MAHKEPRTVKEMLSIANSYAAGEEALLETRGNKKTRKSSQPESSKGKDKKRKGDKLVVVVKRPRRRAPNPEEYQRFLDSPCIWHDKGNHKTKDCYSLKGYTKEILKKTGGSKKAEGARDKEDDEFSEPK